MALVLAAAVVAPGTRVAREEAQRAGQARTRCGAVAAARGRARCCAALRIVVGGQLRHAPASAKQRCCQGTGTEMAGSSPAGNSIRAGRGLARACQRELVHQEYELVHQQYARWKAKNLPPVRRKLCLLGERNSGTNLVERILMTFFERCVCLRRAS